MLRGPILIPIVLAIAAITAASFFLNAVFAFAISRPGRAARSGRRSRRHEQHLAPMIASGRARRRAAARPRRRMVVTRWGHPWFAISLGIVVGVMMVCYVAVPSRLIGVKPDRRDATSSPHGASAARSERVVCTPPVPARARRHPDARIRVLLIPRDRPAGSG